MDTWVWILIAVVVVLIVLGAIGYFAQRRRTQGLQDRFGSSEYDRTLETEGGRRSAERELREREKRHEELDLRAAVSGSSTWLPAGMGGDAT